jgi:hypothetical protein
MKTAVMKTLKQFLMIGAFVFLASLTAFAQKDNDQKKDPPPKEKPPVVIAPDKQKPPKENPPRENPNRPKKPSE